VTGAAGTTGAAATVNATADPAPQASSPALSAHLDADSRVAAPAPTAAAGLSDATRRRVVADAGAAKPTRGTAPAGPRDLRAYQATSVRTLRTAVGSATSEGMDVSDEESHSEAAEAVAAR
jgi:hypothetical protein